MSANTPVLQSQAAAGRAMWFEEHRADLSAPKYTNKMLQLEIHYVGAWGAIRLSGIHCFKRKKKNKKPKIPGKKSLSRYQLTAQQR